MKKRFIEDICEKYKDTASCSTMSLQGLKVILKWDRYSQSPGKDVQCSEHCSKLRVLLHHLRTTGQDTVKACPLHQDWPGKGLQQQAQKADQDRLATFFQ